MINLLPCPCCGSSASYVEFDDPDQDVENFGGTVVACGAIMREIKINAAALKYDGLPHGWEAP